MAVGRPAETNSSGFLPEETISSLLDICKELAAFFVRYHTLLTKLASNTTVASWKAQLEQLATSIKNPCEREFHDHAYLLNEAAGLQSLIETIKSILFDALRLNKEKSVFIKNEIALVHKVIAKLGSRVAHELQIMNYIDESISEIEQFEAKIDSWETVFVYPCGNPAPLIMDLYASLEKLIITKNLLESFAKKLPEAAQIVLKGLANNLSEITNNIYTLGEFLNKAPVNELLYRGKAQEVIGTIPQLFTELDNGIKLQIGTIDALLKENILTLSVNERDLIEEQLANFYRNVIDSADISLEDKHQFHDAFHKLVSLLGEDNHEVNIYVSCVLLIIKSLAVPVALIKQHVAEADSYFKRKNPFLESARLAQKKLETLEKLTEKFWHGLLPDETPVFEIDEILKEARKWIHDPDVFLKENFSVSKRAYLKKLHALQRKFARYIENMLTYADLELNRTPEKPAVFAGEDKAELRKTLRKERIHPLYEAIEQSSIKDEEKNRLLIDGCSGIAYILEMAEPKKDFYQEFQKLTIKFINYKVNKLNQNLRDLEPYLDADRYSIINDWSNLISLVGFTEHNGLQENLLRIVFAMDKSMDSRKRYLYSDDKALNNLASKGTLLYKLRKKMEAKGYIVTGTYPDEEKFKNRAEVIALLRQGYKQLKEALGKKGCGYAYVRRIALAEIARNIAIEEQEKQKEFTPDVATTIAENNFYINANREIAHLVKRCNLYIEDLQKFCRQFSYSAADVVIKSAAMLKQAQAKEDARRLQEGGAVLSLRERQSLQEENIKLSQEENSLLIAHNLLSRLIDIQTKLLNPKINLTTKKNNVSYLLSAIDMAINARTLSPAEVEANIFSLSDEQRINRLQQHNTLTSFRQILGYLSIKDILLDMIQDIPGINISLQNLTPRNIPLDYLSITVNDYMLDHIRRMDELIQLKEYDGLSVIIELRPKIKAIHQEIEEIYVQNVATETAVINNFLKISLYLKELLNTLVGMSSTRKLEQSAIMLLRNYADDFLRKLSSKNIQHHIFVSLREMSQATRSRDYLTITVYNYFSESVWMLEKITNHKNYNLLPIEQRQEVQSIQAEIANAYQYVRTTAMTLAKFFTIFSRLRELLNTLVVKPGSSIEKEIIITALRVRVNKLINELMEVGRDNADKLIGAKSLASPLRLKELLNVFIKPEMSAEEKTKMTAQITSMSTLVAPATATMVSLSQPVEDSNIENIIDEFKGYLHFVLENSVQFVPAVIKIVTHYQLQIKSFFPEENSRAQIVPTSGFILAQLSDVITKPCNDQNEKQLRIIANLDFIALKMISTDLENILTIAKDVKLKTKTKEALLREKLATFINSQLHQLEMLGYGLNATEKTATPPQPAKMNGHKEIVNIASLETKVDRRNLIKLMQSKITEMGTMLETIDNDDIQERINILTKVMDYRNKLSSYIKQHNQEIYTDNIIISKRLLQVINQYLAPYLMKNSERILANDLATKIKMFATRLLHLFDDVDALIKNYHEEKMDEVFVTQNVVPPLQIPANLMPENYKQKTHEIAVIAQETQDILHAEHFANTRHVEVINKRLSLILKNVGLYNTQSAHATHSANHNPMNKIIVTPSSSSVSLTSRS